MSIGGDLQLARARRGLTLRDVAQHTGLPVSYLADLERGLVPDAERALRIISAWVRDDEAAAELAKRHDQKG